MDKSVRAIKLLNIRSFELKSDVHEVFDKVWGTLIRVDIEHQSISIGSPQGGKFTCLGVPYNPVAVSNGCR